MFKILTGVPGALEDMPIVNFKSCGTWIVYTYKGHRVAGA